MQPFSTEFTLSREYLAESYDQSLPHGKSAKPNFIVPALLIAVGVGFLMFIDQTKIAGGMLLAMGVLELLHSRYRRAWWLARQMWGRSANCEVTLNVDSKGIQTKNPFTETALAWVDIERVIETELGLILVTRSGGRQYLSKSLFSAEWISEIVTRKQTS